MAARERVLHDFSEYYQKQAIVETGEFETFLTILQSPLPTSFRIDLTSARGHDLVKEFESRFESFEYNDEDDVYTIRNTVIHPPRALTWYPPRLGKAWQLDCGRSVFVKGAKVFPEIKTLHEFLKFHTDCGHISRQEAVSMIPPLFLMARDKNEDPAFEYTVLDMCAAPGSKSAQLIEMNGHHDDTSGFLVANDASNTRAYLLVHQLARLGLKNTVVTNHLGQTFPGLYDTERGQLKSHQVFDRILCDVPCSGDGTTRKNPTIWKTWHIGNALTLHRRQLEIALRSAALLNIGGRMVYSTCSLNPIENEAVVAELVRVSRGNLSLVDCAELCPTLLRRRGLLKWKVAWQSKSKSKLKTPSDLEYFDEFEHVPEELKASGRIVPSMFAQPDNVELERCMRIMPQDQNTGGFFIAVLTKSGPLPDPWETMVPLVLTAAHVVSARPHVPPTEYVCKLCQSNEHYVTECTLATKKSKAKSATEEQQPPPPPPPSEEESLEWSSPQLKFRQLTPSAWTVISDFYGISPNFPMTSLFCRTKESTSIYLVDERIHRKCLEGQDINIVNTGIQVFGKTSNARDGMQYRPSQSGLSILLPYMTKRVIHLDHEAFQAIVYAHGRQARPIVKTKLSLEMQHRLEAVVGPAVIVLQSPDGPAIPPPGKDNCPPALTVWIGHLSISALTSPRSMSTLMDHIDTPVLDTIDEPLVKA